MPEPRGVGFTMTVYVDCDLGGDCFTFRSRTGFAVFLNGAPTYWMSKKQSSFQVRTYGSDLTAIKQAVEYVHGLQYKIKMMGIPYEDPAFVYGDNKLVLANASMLVSTLNKKMKSLSYCFMPEGCARDEWCTLYVNTHINLADLFIKYLPSGEKWWGFVRRFLNWLWQSMFDNGVD